MRALLSVRTTAVWISLVAIFSACTSTTESSSQQVLAAPRRSVSDLSTLQPLICPAATAQQSPVGVLGLVGGSVALGANRLTVPLGAIPSLTAFQITAPAGDAVEVDVSAVGLASFFFQAPVSITIDYSRCAPDAIPDGATLQVVYIDSDTKQILASMGGVNDPVARTITFQTSHLSGYEVAY